MPGSIDSGFGTSNKQGDDAGTRRLVRAYILENLLLGTDDKLDDGASLIVAGILDSTGAMELVAFLEQEFGLTVREEELVPENLDSIDHICRFIADKRAAVTEG